MEDLKILDLALEKVNSGPSLAKEVDGEGDKDGNWKVKSRC